MSLTTTLESIALVRTLCSWIPVVLLFRRILNDDAAEVTLIVLLDKEKVSPIKHA